MAEEAAKKGGRRKLVVIMLPVLLVAGVGAKMTVLEGKAEAEEATHAEPVEGEIIEVDPLTVNLADKERHYARVGIALVLDATAHAEEVANRIPLLKDAAISRVGAHSSAELRSPEGQESLRKELAEAAKKVWEHGVLRVALTELVVQ